MNYKQKLEYLQTNNLSEFTKIRNIVADEISDGQALLCVCGKMATGLHELYCPKLQNKITKETVKRFKF